MPLQSTTKRGLSLSIEQQEILCSLKFHNDTDQSIIQEFAAHLSGHYIALKNRKKAVKYAIIASGGKLPEDFEFTFSDPFNWYNFLRVLLLSINRLVGIIARPFLPVWYAIFGLFYLGQGIVAHVNKDLVSRNYWFGWFLFNSFACLLALGGAIGLGALIVSLGAPVAVAGVAVWLSSLFFDVGYDFYKYKTEREKEEDLYHQLIEIERDDLAKQVLDKINTMKQDRKKFGIASSIIFIGGILFGISTLFPPLFFALSIAGASLILGTYIYLACKKIKKSWKDPTGFLNHYVRKPCTKAIEHVIDILKEKFVKKKNHGLTMKIPPISNGEIIIVPETPPVTLSPTSIIAETPTEILSSSESIPLESTATIGMKLNEKLKESNSFNHFIEGISELDRDAKDELRTILKAKNDKAWNHLIETIVTKYQDEINDGLFNCNLKRTIKICRNNIKSILKEFPPEHPEYEAIKKIVDKQLQFFSSIENEFNGDPSNDLPKVKLSNAELNQVFSDIPLVDWKLKNIKTLLILMGIKDIPAYKKQYQRWKEYYTKNSGRNLSPFFDRDILTTCTFESQVQENRRLLKVNA